jgi:eukaryotic-like serine/threonine-protein kinase
MNPDGTHSLSSERRRELSEQLDAALELPADALPAWLAALRARDPEAASWMARVLALRENAQFAEFLQDGALPAGLAPVGSFAGRQVGPYVIETELGRGGMGAVWRARRSDGSFESTVAVKFPHSFMLGGPAEQRFRAEGRLLARLDHPHIARLIDAGILEATQPYLVLEYVEGEPIDRYCERLGLPLRERIVLFLSVAAAVAHAHVHLVVHRDLKPSNILVTGAGAVKLLDFGIAKLLADEEAAAATQTGIVALTPQYAAPEQVLGEPVTTRTDVYSLGLVLYLLLTGRPAVVTEGRSSAQVVHDVVTQSPARPSLVALVPQVRGDELAGDLDNIVGKALKKAPAERYESAEALAEDLRRFLEHEPVRARSDTLLYRTGKFVRRHRIGVALAVAASLALLATSGIALWQAYAAGRERDAALVQERRADSVGEFMSTLLGDFSRSGTPEAQRAYLDHARELLARKHYADPLLRADLLNHLAGRYEEFGYPDTAIELMQQAKGDLRSADDQVALAQVGCALADMYDDQKREIDAEREIRAAMTTLDSLGSKVRPEVRADCLYVESYVATARRKNREAIGAAQKGLDELNAAGLKSGIMHVTALNALARANAYAGNNAVAIRLLREIRSSEAESGAPQTIGAWIHEFNEARDLLAGGRVLEAERLGADLQATSHGGDSASHDLTLLRGEIFLALNRNAEAAQLLRQADATAPAPAQLLRALAEIEARLRSSDAAGARQVWSRWRAVAENSLGAGDAEAVAVLRTQALLARAAGDQAAARELLNHAASLAVDADGSPTPQLRTIEALQSEAALERNAEGEASKFADAVLRQASAEAVDTRSSAWIGQGLLLRSRCRQERGELDGMRESARAALPQLEENLGAAHPFTLLAHTLAVPQTAAPASPATGS